MADVDIRIRTIDQTGQGIRSIESKLKGFVSTIGTVTAGVTVMAGVFKKAFDFAEQGAQLEFIETKFGRLAASIGSDSDTILAALTEVTRGTMTTAQMMETASQIISLGLGKNEEDVVRLASLVTNLGWDMQQVILTFANDSKMRLDALGLSVEDVTRRAKAFEEAGHDASRAFDLAVLEAGEAKLQLVGSAADSSTGAYLRLKVMIGETTDEWKRQLAEGITPVVQALNNDYGRAIETTIQGQIDQAQSMEEMIALAGRLSQGMEGLGDNITGTSQEMAAGLEEVLKRIARQTNGWEEYRRALYEAGITGNEATEIFWREIEALVDLDRATGIAEQRMEQFALQQEMVARQQAAAAEASLAQGNAYDYLIDRSILLNQQMQEYGESLTHVEQRYIGFASAADVINANLERQHALLIANNQVFGEHYAQVLRTGETTFSAAESLLHFATQAGANATVLALLTAATGNYDRAQIASMLTHAALTTKAQELGNELANNNITVNQALTELTALQERMAQGIDIPGLPNTIQQVSSLRDKLLETAGNYDVNINVHTTGDFPSVPGSQNPQSPDAQVPFASGGVVSGGIPGRDSVPALLMPGERVLTVDQNRAYEKGLTAGGMNVTIQNYFNYPPPNPAVWAEQAATELGNRMRG